MILSTLRRMVRVNGRGDHGHDAPSKKNLEQREKPESQLETRRKKKDREIETESKRREYRGGRSVYVRNKRERVNHV